MDKVVRCAIYTRKSTEEGLELEYNTLEAQRDAGRNYIMSQKHQGWIEIPEHYDDGGFSGGTLDRPALQRLIHDVEENKVDMIVVYKIDRLTRSLLDFSKLIETLDKHNCSFVSVTQNFNTYDSMGRLTLNVLLSFAQFEREVITERIRDKIAASKKKGLWLGGITPFGYDLVDKKLFINEEEAKVVRLIFEQYKLHQSELYVVNLLKEKGIKAKLRTTNHGRISPEFTHARINIILRNPVYMGKIRHKDQIYEGQHEAIISEKLFQEVQEIRRENASQPLSMRRFNENSILKGILYSGLSQVAMVTTQSNKNNKVYVYYTSLDAVKEGYGKCKLGNIPAGTIEAFMFSKIKPILQSPKVISLVLCDILNDNPNIDANKIIEVLKTDYDSFINAMEKTIKRKLLVSLVKKVELFPERAIIIFTDLAVNLMTEQERNNFGIDHNKTAVFPLEIRRGRQGHKRICDAGQISDERIIQHIAQAFQWQHEIDVRGISIERLASEKRKSRSYVGKIIKLTHLCPDIVKSIFEGKLPDKVRIMDLIEGDIPILWEDQKKKYGFA